MSIDTLNRSNIPEEINTYLEGNIDYHVDAIFGFGDLKSDDSRFKSIFQDLESEGYKPKKGYTCNKSASLDRIIITVPQGTKQIPDNVQCIVDSYPDVEIIEVRIHNTRSDNPKLKFGLRDTVVENYLYED